MKEINNEQLGWLEITYLSYKIRICKCDKGTLFFKKNKFTEFIQEF